MPLNQYSLLLIGAMSMQNPSDSLFVPRIPRVLRPKQFLKRDGRKSPQAYTWITRHGNTSSPYPFASGYNSNNDHRIPELDTILKQNPHASPEEVIRKFYVGMSHDGRDETQGYMRKLYYVMKFLGYEIGDLLGNYKLSK